MKILVTGATGFIGRFLCSRLIAEGFEVHGAVRVSENLYSLVQGVKPVKVESLGPDTVWNHVLEGVDTIIHLAARVHIMNDSSADPLADYRKVNLIGTVRLANEAARAGVRRLVFISSIKVNGEESSITYNADSIPLPSDLYGVSKWEAEQALRSIEVETGLEIVVVRPPLAYGPGVKANFLNMLKIIKKGLPLPLSSVANKRSLIYVGNLVDALTACTVNPAAAGQTYLVSDGEDVSTPELIKKAANALGLPARIFPFPASFLRLFGILLGESGVVNRLTGSLTVDSTKIRRELGWEPPFSLDEGIAETTRWFIEQT